MKTKISMLVFVICFVILSACQSKQNPPTEIATSAPTETPIPTNTTEPTATLEPSPTPVAYSAVLDETFSNVQVLYKDDFNYRIQGESPTGWVSTDDNAVMRIVKDDNVKITPRAGGFGGGVLL